MATKYYYNLYLLNVNILIGTVSESTTWLRHLRSWWRSSQRFAVWDANSLIRSKTYEVFTGFSRLNFFSHPFFFIGTFKESNHAILFSKKQTIFLCRSYYLSLSSNFLSTFRYLRLSHFYSRGNVRREDDYSLKNFHFFSAHRGKKRDVNFAQGFLHTSKWNIL